MTSCIDEYYKLKAQLGEPVIELETDSSQRKIEKADFSKTVTPPKPQAKQTATKKVENPNLTAVEQARPCNFEPFLKMVKADKQRLNERRNQLYQELEDLDIKIAGLDYVEEKLLILTNG